MKNAYLPNTAAMVMIGNEAISSVKGSVKHRFVVKRINGQAVVTSFPAGQYSYGILKRISPDGTPYEELSKMTLKIRQTFKGISRGESFILRETSQHILNGLKILYIADKSHGGKTMEIGWSGNDDEIAWKQDKGFSAPNPLNEYGAVAKRLRPVTIPARQFRGFQQEFIDNFYSLVDQLR